MDFIKYDMTDIWASAGDVVAPDSSKVNAGWGVEVVPRQWWNWFENRQDNNIAYMLQKGIPEWDATTQYIINKSYVQRNGIVYKATATSTNSDPVALTSWARAFADYSAALAALGSLSPAANQLPYFNGTSTATTTTLSPFAITVLDDADDAAVRATISAQQSNINLTSLSGVTAVSNGLPYFTGTTAMGITSLTTFGRSLIDDVDAASARTTLGVDSSVASAAALNAGLATKQPLATTLTALSAVSTAVNKLPYFTGVGTAATTDLTVFSRSLLATSDSASARSVLGVDSAVNVTAALNAGLATRQPLNDTLTVFSSLTAATNKLPYFTGTNTASLTNITDFSRSLLDTADAVSVRTILSVDSSATAATNLATRQPLNTNLTSFSSLVGVADRLPYFTGAGSLSLSTLTTIGRTLIAGVDATAMRSTLGAASRGANSDITSLTGMTTPLSLSQGGTGGNSASTAVASLGIVKAALDSSTAGEFMLVGHAGWNGGAAFVKGAGTDLNSLQTSSLYACNSTYTNGPALFSGGPIYVRVSVHGATQYIKQEALGIASNLAATRTMIAGVWSAWVSADYRITSSGGTSTNGWNVYSDGTIEQWGLVSVVQSTEGTLFSYNTPFTSVVKVFQCTSQQYPRGAGPEANNSARPETLTQFRVTSGHSASPAPFAWYAKGV